MSRRRVLLALLVTALHLSSNADGYPCSSTEGLPLVRNISELTQDSYGRPGLSHMTIAGSLLHGMKEVEVWLQTFSPGSHTPIHRHSCEEVFVVLKGVGLFILLLIHTPNTLATHKSFLSSLIARFISLLMMLIRKLFVHLFLLPIWNTNKEEDLQFLVVFSRPPVKVFIYDDWHMPHTAAKLKFPYYCDEECYLMPPTKDEL